MLLAESSSRRTPLDPASRVAHRASSHLGLPALFRTEAGAPGVIANARPAATVFDVPRITDSVNPDWANSHASSIDRTP